MFLVLHNNLTNLMYLMHLYILTNLTIQKYLVLLNNLSSH
jgi:hypothetical protein